MKYLILKHMRQGKITASRASAFMTSGRKKDEMFGETAKGYALELALQRMGVDTDLITGMDVTTWQMEWGIEHEADARTVYEQSRGITCGLPGFISRDDETGCTPDGLVGDDGLLEIKCPQWSNHLEYLMNGIAKPPNQKPHEYMYQIQFQMMITDTKWTDFMTFHPEFPDHLKAKVHRIERDNGMIAQMQERIPAFNELIESIINKLQS